MQALLENIQTIGQNQHGLAFVAVFIGGLISAASPCVLAAIPLIIGYVGGYSEGNKKKAALFPLVFVLGLSITFTLLGAAASVMGQFLNFMGSWLYIGLSVIAGLSVGLTESIIRSTGAKNFSLYAKKLSGAILFLVSVYFGMTNL